MCVALVNTPLLCPCREPQICVIWQLADLSEARHQSVHLHSSTQNPPLLPQPCSYTQQKKSFTEANTIFRW